MPNSREDFFSHSVFCSCKKEAKVGYESFTLERPQKSPDTCNKFLDVKFT